MLIAGRIQFLGYANNQIIAMYNEHDGFAVGDLKSSDDEILKVINENLVRNLSTLSTFENPVKFKVHCKHNTINKKETLKTLKTIRKIPKLR